MVRGINLSDLILILLFLDIKTLIIGSFDAITFSFRKTQKNIVFIKHNLQTILFNFGITLFEKQILNLPNFD